MKKLLIAFLMTVGIINADLVNGIALVVNEEPITLYDIDKKMVENSIDKAHAASILIDEMLYNQEIKKNNITIDMFDINNYLEKIAATNNMDLYQFKSIIKQKYKDYSVYEEEIKNQLLRQKLVDKVLRGKLKKPSDADLKIYYDNNLSQFTTASTFNVIQYATKNKRALLAIQKNPMANFKEVQKDEVVLEQAKLNSKFKYLLNDTKVKNFTPIFTANRSFVMLFITKKEGVETQKFEDIKENILQIILGQEEKKYLQEYFEKLKLTADIKVVR